MMPTNGRVWRPESSMVDGQAKSARIGWLRVAGISRMHDLPRLNIRPVTTDDLRAIAEIYAHHVLHGTGTFELDPPSHAEMERRYGDLTEQGYPYLAAVVRGSVIGYAYAGPFRARPAYRFSVEDSIYIDHRYHRQGVGQALLNPLIEACTERGYRQMLAVIGDSENTPSIGLHARAGFTHVGRFVASGFKFDRWIDTVLMQRALGMGDTTLP
jgi:L-amino acid N-acyltransferase YncA